MTRDFKLGAAIGVTAAGAAVTVIGLGIKVGNSIANKVKERKANKEQEITEEIKNVEVQHEINEGITAEVNEDDGAVG